MPLGCLASLFGIRESSPPSSSSAPSAVVPEQLPLQAKRYFFSRDENAFFRRLEEALHGTPYRAVPKVRLNDLFYVTDQAQERAAWNRLRDKHVDFLLLDQDAEFRPVLAIELDGRSHQQEAQRYRDAVKDTIFRSSRLRLLRLESRAYSLAELRSLLQRELPL